jgi:hypothetical protein
MAAQVNQAANWRSAKLGVANFRNFLNKYSFMSDSFLCRGN